MCWYLKGSQSAAATMRVKVASEDGLPVIPGTEPSSASEIKKRPSTGEYLKT